MNKEVWVNWFSFTVTTLLAFCLYDYRLNSQGNHSYVSYLGLDEPTDDIQHLLGKAAVRYEVGRCWNAVKNFYNETIAYKKIKRWYEWVLWSKWRNASKLCDIIMFFPFLWMGRYTTWVRWSVLLDHSEVKWKLTWLCEDSAVLFAKSKKLDRNDRFLWCVLEEED